MFETLQFDIRSANGAGDVVHSSSVQSAGVLGDIRRRIIHMYCSIGTSVLVQSKYICSVLPYVPTVGWFTELE